MLKEDTTQRERELSTQVPHGRGARLWDCSVIKTWNSEGGVLLGT